MGWRGGGGGTRNLKEVWRRTHEESKYETGIRSTVQNFGHCEVATKNLKSANENCRCGDTSKVEQERKF